MYVVSSWYIFFVNLMLKPSSGLWYLCQLLTFWKRRYSKYKIHIRIIHIYSMRMNSKDMWLSKQALCIGMWDVSSSLCYQLTLNSHFVHYVTGQWLWHIHSACLPLDLSIFYLQHISWEYAVYWNSLRSTQSFGLIST